MMRLIEAYSGPGLSVAYIDENGFYSLYSGGSRNWRNNNPGNFRPGTVSRRNGQIGVAGNFAVFPDSKTGQAAHVTVKS